MDSDFPAFSPSEHENYNRNIKNFDPGVRLHLPPRNHLDNNVLCSICRKFKDRDCKCGSASRQYYSWFFKRKLFEKRFPQAEQAYQAQLSSMQNRTFSFFLHTGFISGVDNNPSIPRPRFSGQLQTMIENCTEFKYLQEALLA